MIVQYTCTVAGNVSVVACCLILVTIVVHTFVDCFKLNNAFGPFEFGNGLYLEEETAG